VPPPAAATAPQRGRAPKIRYFSAKLYLSKLDLVAPLCRRRQLQLRRNAAELHAMELKKVPPEVSHRHTLSKREHACVAQRAVSLLVYEALSY
jgi:hypothetical protein